MTLALFGFLALVLALGLVLAARRLARLGERVEEAESRLARRLYRVQGRLGELETTVRELEFERRRARGEIRIDPGMPVDELAAIHPRVREILGVFGLVGGGAGGACGSGSAPASLATLRDACGERSLDAAVVLDAVRRFLADPAAPVAVRPDEARLHRITPLPPSRN